MDFRVYFWASASPHSIVRLLQGEKAHRNQRTGIPAAAGDMPDRENRAK